MPGGGSSSVFSSALAAAAFIRSAGAITATFARWRWLVSCAKSISARTRSIAIVSTASSTPVIRIDLQQLESHEVRMLAGHRIAAPRACAAGKPVRARRLAQQRLRELERERVLADAARTVDQQRMRERVPLRDELRHGVLLPRQQRQPRQRGRRRVVVAPLHGQLRVERLEMRLERRAHGGERPRAVDHAEAARVRRRALEIGVADAVEERAGLALELVERRAPPPASASSRSRDTRVGTSNSSVRSGWQSP